MIFSWNSFPLVIHFERLSCGAFQRLHLELVSTGKNILYSAAKTLSVGEPSVLRLKHPTMHLQEEGEEEKFLLHLTSHYSDFRAAAGDKSTVVLQVILGLMTGNVTLSGFLSFVLKDGDGRDVTMESVTRGNISAGRRGGGGGAGNRWRGGGTLGSFFFFSSSSS